MNHLNDHEIDDHNDQKVIDQVLTDVDPDGADSLRPLLAELRTLAHGGPVEPGPLLEALLLPEDRPAAGASGAPGSASAGSGADDDTRAVPVLQVLEGDGPRRPARRRRAAQPARRRRPLAAALVLTAAIGAGTAAAAAADEGFRSALGDGISSVMSVLGGRPASAPSTPTSPAPAPTGASAATPQSVPSSAAVPNAKPSSGARAASPAPTGPRTTAPGAEASTSPEAGLGGVPSQLPSPNLGIPLPPLPTVPGSLPQPTAPAGLPGGLP
ncbi:hypothetical protein [Sinomonas susongensis]|uniref:hypothetical protein n=1 Tax=Sinomonas susongensis TaxID=1324851 RepID=UPI001108521A|nr:hypothetical protein [Sinomonas susongensis]